MSKIDELTNEASAMQKPVSDIAERGGSGAIAQLIQQYCPDLPAGRQDLPADRQVGWNIEVLPNDESRWYTYVLLCDNATLYKGFTNNLEKRYKRHCAGDGADYTRKNKPLGLSITKHSLRRKRPLKEKSISSRDRVENG